MRWLGTQASELGVELYPGFAASEVLYDEKQAVVGVATNDMGISKTGEKLGSFQRGMELRAKQTLFAEGARGSLSELVMKKFNLRQVAAAPLHPPPCVVVVCSSICCARLTLQSCDVM